MRLYTLLSRDIHVRCKDVPWYLRKRYLVTFLAFLGITCMSLMRTNLGIALVEMTFSKEINIGNETRYLVSCHTGWPKSKFTDLQKVKNKEYAV